MNRDINVQRCKRTFFRSDGKTSQDAECEVPKNVNELTYFSPYLITSENGKLIPYFPDGNVYEIILSGKFRLNFSNKYK